MRKGFALILMIILLCTVLPGVSEDRSDEDACVLFAVSAGKADALLLKVCGHAFLIDTGYARSRGKILYAMDLLNISCLDGVFITHTDSDHTDGLEWLAQSGIPVHAWYAPAMYTGVKEKNHPMLKAAAERAEKVTWLKAGDKIELGEAAFTVLAPGIQADDKDNNNSLVMLLTTPFGSILLCGDMEYPEEEWLLSSGADLHCDVLKVANHGDNDTCSTAFIRAAAPSFAVISTDSEEKSDTPDPGLLRRLITNGCRILETQRASGGIRVSLTASGVLSSFAVLPEACTDVGIDSVRADAVRLENTGTAETDLSGWYMITDRKNSLFVFPEGTVLQPGQTLTVAARSSSVSGDIIWDEKKPINSKKEDGVTLYDRYGNRIAYRTNGI